MFGNIQDHVYNREILVEVDQIHNIVNINIRAKSMLEIKIAASEISFSWRPLRTSLKISSAKAVGNVIFVALQAILSFTTLSVAYTKNKVQEHFQNPANYYVAVNDIKSTISCVSIHIVTSFELNQNTLQSLWKYQINCEIAKRAGWPAMKI
uniref:Uncharacterized protein n=1 Tax=Glossina brevipalpis TaxID=37001 RepID=A0A1A9WU02_9MUSC